MLTKTRVRLGTVGAVVLASGAVALGTGIYDAAPAAAHHRHHHHGCIPQHNRGDHDADNRGGPSDGDGCR
jgi:hypothetical protein